MLNQQACVIQSQYPVLDFNKWQKLVNLLAVTYGSASGVIVQYRQQVFNVVSASENSDNFLYVNAQWPWDMKSFCRKIMETRDKLYVKDAASDPDWLDAEPVCQGPVRSYLGYPLFWPDGNLFGSFCVIDTKATNYSLALIDMLGQLKQVIESDLLGLYDHLEMKRLLEQKNQYRDLLNTEQKRRSDIQTRLSHFELINSMVLDSLSDSVIRIDQQGVILAANHAVEQMLGYDSADLVGQNVKVLMPKHTAEQHDMFLQRLMDYPSLEPSVMQVQTVRRDNTKFMAQLSVTVISIGGEKQFIGLLTDITDKLAYESHLKSLALYDSLTGCANRNLLIERFKHLSATADRNANHFSIAYIDLNKFKPVNDTYGHQCGDLVLTKSAQRIKKIVRKTDLVARVGGDEFVILFTAEAEQETLVAKLKKAIAMEIRHKSHRLHISCSVGMAKYPTHGNTLEQLIAYADKLMYRDKLRSNTTESV